ncbi:MAG TPA: ABC transporter permease [Caulobacter sp.]|nr:ABC transporter permease [Caulobacter sp.]
MLRSYLLTLYRSLTRHTLFSAINILGLAVGLAVFLVLWIAVRFETSYDRWIPDAETTYRVQGLMHIPGRARETLGVVPGPVLPALQAEAPDLEAGVRILTGSVPVRRGGFSDYEEVLFADGTFFEIFDLPLVAGERSQAIADTSGLVISQAMARKYFGGDNVLGQRITLVTDGTPRDYRISGVLKDLPENTHLKIGFLARLDRSVTPDMAEFIDQWNATNYATYIRMKSRDAAKALDARLGDIMQRRAGETHEWLSLKLEPLTDIHFNTAPLGAWKPGIDRGFVSMLEIIGVLTLALAVINYVNLSTARSGLRAREVALRKVFGGTRGALTGQFLLEAVAVTLVSALIALALVELTLPLVNTALGSPLELDYVGEGGVLPVFAMVTVLVGLAAGVWPALVLSGFEPAGVLAASRSPGGGRNAARVREALVVVQFSVAIALLIGAAVVFAQSDFVRRADLGFQREKLINIRQLGAPELVSQTGRILEAVRRTPGVESATVSGRYPGRGGVGRSSSFAWPGFPDPRGASLSMEFISDQYFETYRMRLLAGRRFDAANRMDDMYRPSLEGQPAGEGAASGLNVIINETGSRALLFKRPADAIGKTIRSGASGTPLTIVGVVADSRFGSPREKAPPILYLRNTAPGADLTGDQTITLRYRGEPQAMLARLRDTWRATVADYPFKAETVETSLDAFYEPDERRSLLVTLGAVVAALIGILGLYGLAAFTAERRTREIGIRKVLGASTADVFRLLVGQFLRPVVVANLIAWPVAFWLMREWLAEFDQRIALTPLYWIGATLLAVAVALATVTGQALKVAGADPGSALRDE